MIDEKGETDWKDREMIKKDERFKSGKRIGFNQNSNE